MSTVRTSALLLGLRDALPVDDRGQELFGERSLRRCRSHIGIEFGGEFDRPLPPRFRAELRCHGEELDDAPMQSVGDRSHVGSVQPIVQVRSHMGVHGRQRSAAFAHGDGSCQIVAEAFGLR